MFPLELDSLYPAIQALGWSLIHFLWQGALVGAIYAAGGLTLRRARPSARYFWGLLCMAVLALLPPFTFWVILDSGPATQTAASTALSLGAVAALSPEGPINWVELSLPWVVLAWLIGVVGLSLKVTLNWRHMRRLSRVGVIPLSDELLNRVNELCGVFGIRTAVTVLESTIVRVPTVLGWLKPVILLPTSTMVGLTPQQLELVIAHELGHIQRLDYLVNLFQVLVETTLFYHPVVNLISRRVRDEREKCCDDLVVSTFGNRLEYAKALTNLETMRSGALSPALAATDGQLLQRIERIVCHHTTRRRDAMGGSSLVLLAFAAVVIAAGQLADPLQRMESDESQLAEILVSELMVPTIQPQPEPVFVVSKDSAQIASPAPMVVDDGEPQAQRNAKPSSVMADAQVVVPEPSRRVATAPAPRLSVEAPSKREDPDPVPNARRAELNSVAKPDQPPVVVAPPAVNDQPRATRRVAPDYPVRARIAGQQGFVTVEFGIRSDGLVGEVEIIEAEPRRVFERSARRAIRQWRFDPASLENATSRRFTQRFDYTLDSGVSGISDNERHCIPVTGTRICRSESPTSLLSLEAAGG